MPWTGLELFGEGAIFSNAGSLSWMLPELQLAHVSMTSAVTVLPLYVTLMLWPHRGFLSSARRQR